MDKDKSKEQLINELADLRRRIAELEKVEIEHRRMKEESLKLAAIVKSSDDAIIGKTLDGTIISWNPGAENIYGYSVNEVKGKSISILVPPGHPNEVPGILKKLKRGIKIDHYETVRVGKDGKRIQVSLTISPIRDATGKIRGASTIARDITEHKKAEENLKRYSSDLEKQKLSLEQKNLALNEIIEHIERTKNKIKEDIAINVEELIMPLLEKIELKGALRKHVKLLRHHLEVLTSSFGRKITQRSIKLSSRELEVCSMIKGGLSSKEISDVLNISYKTIDKYRRNIRKKLGISKKKVNLTSFLKAL